MAIHILLLYNNYTSIFFYAIEVYKQLLKYKVFEVHLKHIKSIQINNLSLYNAIIPLDVKSCIFYHSMKLSPFHMSDTSIFNRLNDKSSCYHIIKKYSTINHIPTLDVFTLQSISKFVDKHPSEKYIIKNTTGYGSFFQNIVSHSKLLKIDVNKLKNCIVQPCFKNYKVYSIDIISKNGIIYGELLKKVDNTDGIKFIDFLIASIDCTVEDSGFIYEAVKNFTKNIIKDVNYSGMCEIEFIVTDDNSIYFLEINPRISGHVCQLNKYNQNAYFNNIIIPYLSFFNINIHKNKMLSNRYTGSSLRHVLFGLYSIYPKTFITIIVVDIFILFIVFKKLYNLYRR